MALTSTPRAGLAGLLRRPAVLLTLALLVLAGLVSLLGRLAGGPETAVKRVALSDDPGMEMYAAFSPDGARVAYSARGAGRDDSFHIFVRPAAGGPARQLTSGGTSDVGPAWSPDGAQLAFLRTAGERATYVTMSAASGAVKKIGETEAPPEGQQEPSVAWTRDGRSLIVVERGGDRPQRLALLPVAGGAATKLTTPPEGSEGDAMPAVSPDGGTVAFLRRNTRDSANIWTCDLSGGSLRRVTFDDRAVRGLSWSADGREIVYSSNPYNGWQLWRISAAGGAPREIRDAGRQAQYPAVARRGSRLVFSDSPSVSAIWRAEVNNPENERPIIRSSGRESAPTWSPDGEHIVYRSDRSGAEEIWVAGPDGSGARQVTALKGMRPGRPRWSPDGRTLVFEGRSEGRPDIYTVPASGGNATRITASGASSPSWSRDGKWIYYGQRQVWRMTPEGGTPERLVARGGNAIESPDGKWIYFQRQREICRMPAGGGDEEELFGADRNFIWASFVPVSDGVYYLDWDRDTRAVRVSFYSLADRTSKPVLSMRRADMDRGASFDISPDRKYIIYAKVDQTETNLAILEGFR